jgi:hypothetical protein
MQSEAPAIILRLFSKVISSLLIDLAARFKTPSGPSLSLTLLQVIDGTGFAAGLCRVQIHDFYIWLLPKICDPL